MYNTIGWLDGLNYHADAQQFGVILHFFLKVLHFLGLTNIIRFRKNSSFRFDSSVNYYRQLSGLVSFLMGN